MNFSFCRQIMLSRKVFICKESKSLTILQLDKLSLIIGNGRYGIKTIEVLSMFYTNSSFCLKFSLTKSFLVWKNWKIE